MADEFIIFTGTANSRLAVNVAREVGVQLGARAVERFPDGEISVRLDEPARGREVFIVQPTSPPVNEHLVELMAFADACRRASAAHVTAIIPYFGYARSDKRHGRREPIMASMVADLIQAVRRKFTEVSVIAAAAPMPPAHPAIRPQPRAARLLHTELAAGAA